MPQSLLMLGVMRAIYSAGYKLAQMRDTARDDIGLTLMDEHLPKRIRA